MGFGALNVINTFLVYVAALFLMIKISPVLTLWAIIPFPSMVFVVKKLSSAMFRRSKVVQEELARLTSNVEENVSATPLIKAYCREEAAVAAFEKISNAYMDSNMKIAKLRGFMIPIMSATGAVGTLIVLLLGGRQVISGALTLGDFVAFNSYLAMLIWPTIMFGWILNLIQRGAASMSRLNEIIHAEARVAEPEEPVIAEAIRGEIEIKNLSFSYNNKPVLEDISLTVPAGFSIGIAGGTGSGKTTLVSLLARLYPVSDNKIFIDGIDINSFPLNLLRGAVGYVPQESFLFSRTIAANIAFGMPDAGLDEVKKSAKQANLHKDIEGFQQGYETVVGERGITLSGGQKQRVAIARLFLKDSPVFILDDPLSAVDAKTEEEILASIKEYYGKKTVIIVSHRLSVIRNCDNIVYLENGRIIEQGNHRELLELGGAYSGIWREEQIRQEIERY